MMYQETMSEVLKWTVLVFAAGFIGFFGKYLGKILLMHLGKDKGNEGADTRPASPAPPEEPGPPRDEKLMKKAEKNRLKEEKKRSKKVSTEGTE